MYEAALPGVQGDLVRVTDDDVFDYDVFDTPLPRYRGEAIVEITAGRSISTLCNRNYREAR